MLLLAELNAINNKMFAVAERGREKVRDCVNDCCKIKQDKIILIIFL